MEWIAQGIDRLERAEVTGEKIFDSSVQAALARSKSIVDTFLSVAPHTQRETLPDLKGLERGLSSVLDDFVAPIRRERAWLESIERLVTLPSTVGAATTTTAPTTTHATASFSDPDAFRAASGPVIDADPLLATRIASMIAALAGGQDGMGGGRGFVVVDAAGAPVSVAMVPSTMTLDVLPMPVQAVPGLAAAIAGEGLALRGVRGDVAAATSFADQWCAQTGQAWSPTASKCLHRLGTLTEPNAPGGLRLAAGEDDAKIVHRWTHEFGVEAVAGDAPPSLPAVARKLESNLAWLWCDETGTPVSYVGASPSAFGVQRIGPVYTPPEHRGHGYASAATAGVAADLAERPDVSQVCLFTDLANETSNRIYWAIGFEPAFGTIELAFS